MVLLELLRDPGLYSPVQTGMALLDSCLFRTSGLLYSCEVHLWILLQVWQGNSDASQGEAGDPGSLSSCHRDIGIPIHFQEESGIVSF